MKFHKYTQTERTNILSPYIQDKLKSAKLNLILNLGFPQNLIDNMLPYIEDEAPYDKFFRCRSGRTSADIGRCN